MKRTTILAGLAAIISACKGAPPLDQQRAAEAVRLAQRFVYADAAGDFDLVDSVYAPKEDMAYCETGFEAYQVIASVSIDAPHARGDTIIVPLTYDVLGFAHSEDSHQVGQFAGRFTPAPSIERDSLVGAPDSNGRFRFCCWRQVVPNHMTADRMSAKWVPALDSASLAAWNAVDKQRPNMRLKLPGGHK